MKKHIFILGLALAGLFGAEPAAAQYVVIVNAASSVSSVSASDLSKIFQKKDLKFADGSAAVPVDLDKSSAVREAFSQAVHGRGVAQIEAYWQQQIFAGKDVPPETKGSDAEVIAFVSGTPGAIGYVASGADLGSGVKAVTVN